MLGYCGAELLDQLMSGACAPVEPVRIPAAGIIVRKSSDILTIRHQGVARSLRHIWEHGHEPICINDLVGVSAMSRRGLHKAFLEHLGRTPGQELQRVRIEHAEYWIAPGRTSYLLAAAKAAASAAGATGSARPSACCVSGPCPSSLPRTISRRAASCVHS